MLSSKMFLYLSLHFTNPILIFLVLPSNSHQDLERLVSARLEGE
jgi:hypothetical protein